MSDLREVKIGSDIQADWLQNDPMAASYIRNRPFYEEKKKVFSPLNLTWDGNTEGLEKIEITLEGEGTYKYYKVSEDVFPNEQLKKMILTFDNGDQVNFTDPDVAELVKEKDDYFSFSNLFIVARKKEIFFEYGEYIEDITLPSTGVYFLKTQDNEFIASLSSTEPVEHTETIIHKIDSKFLLGIPYFDLTEMGLEPISDQIQSIEGDMTKICEALAKGPAVFRFSIYAPGGGIVDSTQVVTAARQDLPGVGVIYQSNEIVVGSPTEPGKLYRFVFFINESGNFMNVISIPLIFATELQLHFSEETGKFETARLKMSDGTTVNATRY